MTDDVGQKAPSPERPTLAPEDPRSELVDRLRRALHALPLYFNSETRIHGIEMTDLFSLNSLLGGAIETQVVETLNGIRQVWDPDNKYLDYSFRRTPQTFPDVRLVREGETTPTVGIELKGWYLLAKEMAPSFRYAVTPVACADHDLLVVVPWHLKDVLSGKPVALKPWIENARYAAEYRNYWWRHIRGTEGDTTIKSPGGVAPYPASGARISDVPVEDGGKNFGRVARLTGLMDDYVTEMLGQPISGVEAGNWVRFIKRYTEGHDPIEIAARLDQELGSATKAVAKERGQVVADLIRALADEMKQCD